MIKKCVLVLVMMSAVTLLHAQKEKVQAGYIYQFTNYINWTDAYRTGEFVIAVLGDNPVISELTAIAALKKVGNQTIVVKKIDNPGQIGKYHIVFVPASRTSQLDNVLAAVSDKNTLVITDGNGLIKKGAGISFVLSNGKLLFELNKEVIEKQGLYINSRLVQLASNGN